MSDSLRQNLNSDLKVALRAKDQVTMSTIRLIVAAIKDRDIDARAKGNEDGLSDQEILSLLQTMVKQRKESICMYSEGGRQELADREAAEIEVIERYMPKQMSEDEIASAIDGLVSELNAEGMKDMGKVMGALKTRFVGSIDMGAANKILKEKLSA